MNQKTGESEDFILVLREVPYHPNSYLAHLADRFEAPSILHVSKKEELRKYRTPPLFNPKYLVIFEDLKTLQDNLAFIRFSRMFPVLVVENRSQFDDAIFFLTSSKVAYKVYVNEFTKQDAWAFVSSHASVQVSEAFCKAVVRQVGASPLRILTALNVCEQMGYTIKNVERYVDKYTYVDKRKLIDTLLGVPRSKAAVRSSFLYLQINRHWYRYVQEDLVEELSDIIRIYHDKLDGVLRKENLFSYLEENGMTRARVMYALSLFDRVSIVSIFALREFIKSANLLEVVAQIS